MSTLSQVDPQIAAAVEAEKQRQSNTLELIASENHVSAAVLEALGSVLTDKYAEGYPGQRCYCGCENVDTAEQICIDRARKLFGAEHANVQPHSGSSANLSVFTAALKPGQKIMGMNLAHGGHLSHGKEVNLSGMLYEAVHYGVRKDTERLDMDEVREMALRERPALLIAGASAYPRQIDFAAFGEIARECGALLLSDIAHIAGLVVAGEHPDPVPHSTFVTTTNHKTLRGPRGGIILCRGEWGRAIDRAVFPGIQGGPLEHVIAAKAVALGEAMHPAFHEYARRILSNASVLAETLTERGWRLVSGGTDNHLMLVDLHSRFDDLYAQPAATMLQEAGIVSNANAIPFDPPAQKKWTGIRLGTPAITSRGLGSEEVRLLGEWIDEVLVSRGDAAVTKRVHAAVEQMCGRFPVPNSSY
jgi:glycine hydroxymethyltransferase